MNDEDFELKPFRLGNKILELYVTKDQENLPCFVPNTVTAAIAENVPVDPGEIIVEAGAGIGPITILMAQKEPLFQHIYTTEIKHHQVEAAIRNMEHYGLQNKVTVFQGDVLEPIRLNRFINPTMIIGDCSALTDIGIELGWYPKQGIPLGGDDGTEVVIRFLRQASEYQCPTYFAIAQNFSDGKKILDLAENCFGRGVTRHLNRVRIPLTRDQINTIDKTKTTIYEPIERKGTRGFWALDIYESRGIRETEIYHPNPEY